MYNWWYLVIAAGVVFFSLGIPCWVSLSGKTISVLENVHNNDFNGIGVFMMIVSSICGFFFIVSLGVTTILTCITHERYYEYLETSQMIERVIEEGSDLENIEINKQIIEYNKKIAEAKAAVKSWGKWSPWSAYDVDALKYVRVYEKDNKIEIVKEIS